MKMEISGPGIGPSAPRVTTISFGPRASHGVFARVLAGFGKPREVLIGKLLTISARAIIRIMRAVVSAGPGMKISRILGSRNITSGAAPLYHQLINAAARFGYQADASGTGRQIRHHRASAGRFQSAFCRRYFHRKGIARLSAFQP